MEKKSDTYQFATDIQWEYAGDGIVRQIMGYDEHLMMVKVKFDQGEKILKVGDGYYVAPNLPHGCVCLEAGVLIDTFCPMREDFLK